MATAKSPTVTTGRSTGGAGAGLGGAYNPISVLPDNTAPPVTNPDTGVTTIPASSTDWVDTFWGSLGLDSSTISGLTQALTGIVDPGQAQALGENYLRGTTWYQNTFPGITAGITAGLFTDETGYRSYVNQLDQATQQYLGRSVSTPEVTQALQGGINPSTYGQKLQGNALAQTLAPEAQYEAGAFGTGQLSQSDLQAYGQEQAGYDTPQGQTIQTMLQNAQKKMSTIFSGTLAAPNLSLGPGGIRATGLQNAAQRGTGNGPDVGS